MFLMFPSGYKLRLTNGNKQFGSQLNREKTNCNSTLCFTSLIAVPQMTKKSQLWSIANTNSKASILSCTSNKELYRKLNLFTPACICLLNSLPLLIKECWVRKMRLFKLVNLSNLETA